MTRPDLVPIERIVIVHAMRSTPDDHWYRALEARLSDHADVVLPTMPSPHEPDAAEWQATLEQEVGSVDPATLVIAHSVGNAAALRFLTSLPAGWQLGSLINVAGFAEAQPGNDLTIPFVQDIDLRLIRESTARRDAVVSTDDPEIPAWLSGGLAESLDSVVHPVEDAGHFRGKEGFASLPLVEELALDAVGAPL